jgi:hypothetical protein
VSSRTINIRTCLGGKKDRGAKIVAVCSVIFNSYGLEEIDTD